MTITHITSKNTFTHSFIFSFDLTEDDINDNISVDDRLELSMMVHNVIAEIITKTSTSMTVKYISTLPIIEDFLEEICGMTIDDVEVITL